MFSVMSTTSIIVRNSSCGKVMFSQVFVCPQGRGIHPHEADPPGRHPIPHPLGQTPPKMATAADDMHPTGMHSCPSCIAPHCKSPPLPQQVFAHPVQGPVPPASDIWWPRLVSWIAHSTGGDIWWLATYGGVRILLYVFLFIEN